MKSYEIEANEPSPKNHTPLENKAKAISRISSKKNSVKECEEASKKLNSIAAKYPFCIIHRTKNNDPL